MDGLSNDTLKQYAKSLLGTISSFGKEDLISDMDALILYKLYKENSDCDNVYKMIYYYYYNKNNDINHRENIFSSYLLTTYTPYKNTINPDGSDLTVYSIAKYLLSTSSARQLAGITTDNYSTPTAEAFAEYFGE